jgi:excisionase family DNA binding protein
MKEKTSPVSALLTTEQAAAYMSIAPITVRRLVRNKLISFVMVTPGTYRFRREDLDEYINSRHHRRLKGI